MTEFMLGAKMEFRFGQFQIASGEVTFEVIPNWNDACSDQGFARTTVVLAVATFESTGIGTVHVFRGPVRSHPIAQCTRVHIFSFVVRNERVELGPPDGFPLPLEFAMASGNYKLLVGQWITTQREAFPQQRIDLVFEHVDALPTSTVIVVADKAIHPTYPMQEMAGRSPEQ